MELNLTKTPVATLSAALDTVSEQPVDIDFTLPDYCPDIEKILRCRITPKIYNRNLSGGQLQIDGTTVVSVLYQDSEKGNIRACEQTLPFSASFRVKDAFDDYITETSVKSEYVNCRALSRRRLTVHGAFSLYAKVLGKGSIDLYSPDNIENIEFKKSLINTSMLSSVCGEQFSVGDEIQITGKPPVELIIDSDVKANITDYKVLPEKLMLNGELSVRILYISDIESGYPEQLDYIIPFSNVLDCEGLDEGKTVCVNLSVMSYDLSLKSDILSENPLINVDSRLCATVFVYTSGEVTAALDAYSTEYISRPELARVSVPVSTKVLSDTFMHKDTLQLDNCNIKEILDFNASTAQFNAAVCDSKLSLNAKLNICILAYNTDDEPIYIERAVDVYKEIELNDDYNSVLFSDLSIISLSYRIGDNNNIEIRCELKYCLALQLISVYNIVSAVSADEEKPVSKKSCALTLYFAQAGESLWDIAKSYNTRHNLISSENELCDDILEESVMLLIPNV